MINKKTALLATIATIAGAILIFGPLSDQASGGGEAVKLEGSWVMVGPTIGMRNLETFIPNPSGRTAAVYGQAISADATAGGLCPNADYLSSSIGEVVLTGPSSVEATTVIYSMNKVAPRDQIECIWVANASAEFTADTQEGIINFSIYPTWGFPGYPNPDADGDLLPDPGAEPILCLQVPFEAKRVPMIPPCTPPAP